MKNIYKTVILFVISSFIVGCSNESMISVDPSFSLSYQKAGKTFASVGTPFYVIPTGSGEFLTLYDGTSGKEWGKEGAIGVPFDLADSLPVNYGVSGIYNLTLVATSTDNFGKKTTREVKTVRVKVIDERNSITSFFVNYNNAVGKSTVASGIFTNDSTIQIAIPNIITDLNLAANFTLNSDSAVVFVNNAKQESGVTIQDFSNPVIYAIKSTNGKVKNYRVILRTYTASNFKSIKSFSLATGGAYGNGEKAVIDENNKTITLNADYATDLKSVRLVLESTSASTIQINNVSYSPTGTKAYNLTTITTMTVVAEDKTTVQYTLNVSTANSVSSFSLLGLTPAPVGVIDFASKTISLNVLNGTDITKLVALWTGTMGPVTVGGTSQANGITVNDFTSPLTYTFKKYNSTTKSYVVGDVYIVKVNVLK